MSEDLKHACGLFGIWAPGYPVAWITVQGLNGQQTRGQESAGIVTVDDEDFHCKKNQGLVIQVFPKEESVDELIGHAALGHIRYSTTGSDTSANVQPFWEDSSHGRFFLGHNGNLINAVELKAELLAQGETFLSTTDSEVIAKLFARAEGETAVERLRAVMEHIKGSYCLGILTINELIFVRDYTGNRPLALGKIGDYWTVASESGVFGNLGGDFIREIEPGEIVVINHSGLQSYPSEKKVQTGMCSFEHMYFLRPDSEFGGKDAYSIRYRAGEILAREYPIDADLVVSVPRSGFYAGDGYSAVSRIPSAHGLIANTHKKVFIIPGQKRREAEYDLKYSATKILFGKRVVVVDDSIVRSTSITRVVQLLRKAGVSEIHLRITYPVITHPCFFGIDMSTRRELIAHQLGGRQDLVEEGLVNLLGVDSVHYLSVPQLVEAIDLPAKVLCLGCVGGRYPIPIEGSFAKDQFESLTAV